MTPAELQSWMDRLNYNVEDVSSALGVTVRSVFRYLSGERQIPATVEKLCECLERQRFKRRAH